MMAIFKSDLTMYLVCGGSAFTISYMWADRALAWLHKRSLGQREEVLRLMSLMFVDTSRSKVTWMMLLSSFGLGFLLFLLLWPHFGLGVFIACVVTVVMWSIPRIIMESLWNRRCNRFVDQMVDGLTMMANGIKAGLSPQQCMERVQQNMPNPISQEFGLALAEIRVGASLAEALTNLANRIPRQDVQMFVTAVNILQETGGNMAETFQTIVYVVRERQKIEKKIEAMTAQGMMQGTIITLVPLGLLVLFYMVDPNYVKVLFTTTLGLIALFVMFTLQIVGGIAMRKIVRIKV
jgi:tight adherence protein B